MTSSLAITVAPGDEESAIPADPEGPARNGPLGMTATPCPGSRTARGTDA